jgi:hypothetical protein
VAIECGLQKSKLLIPASAVMQIAQYEIIPLPLARKGVSGLGRVGSSTVASVRLDGKGGGRTVTAVLLKAQGPLLLGVEVDHTGALHTVERTGKTPGKWLVEVSNPAKRLFSCLDVELVLAEFGWVLQ